jgi:diguanylate cyclase (GGDEF)-like protein/putative nucleotidyltransferase with HDIG domain
VGLQSPAHVPIPKRMGARGERDRLLEELEEARRQIAKLEGELRASAGTDALTGFITADMFRRRLAEEMERRRRHHRPVALIRLGLDGLIAVQQDHGHAAADDVVRAAARVLRGALRSSDVVCRSGSDTFDVLLPETDEPDALACAERVLLELEATELGGSRTVAASAGVSSRADGIGAVALLACAEGALAEARGAGGGRVVSAWGSDADAQENAAGLGRRDAVEVLALALLERDHYTGEHSESVVEMAASVARGLGHGTAEVERVRAAALLHDVGKVGIPDAILNKPGPLTDEERKVMAEHTVIGERILRGIPGFAPIASIVRHEHERWDGKGYPDGISGEQIPIGSRIILACDAYHAMTSDRPYRKRMSHEDAIEEISRHIGTQFDPAVTAALIGHFYGERQRGVVLEG